MALRWLLKEQGHNYPMDKMHAIGALPSAGVTVVGPTPASRLRSLSDVTSRCVAVRTRRAPLGRSADALITRMLGIPMDFIYGYEGYGEVAIAVERGEIEETSPGMPSFLQTYMPMVESKLIYPLLSDGTAQRERRSGSQSVGAQSTNWI